jgi:hypothetical protein
MLNARTPGNGFKLSLVTIGVVAFASLLGCGGGANNNNKDGALGGPPVDSAVPADAADAAATATTSCLKACAHYAATCGAQSCAIDCDVYYSTYEGAVCNPELVAYFDCITALATITCASDFLSFLDARVCPTEHTAVSQCALTMGADCRAEPTFDDSCAATNLPAHFYYCKVNVQPPSGCQPFTTNWFCCP